jgi:hypothetical protein
MKSSPKFCAFAFSLLHISDFVGALQVHAYSGIRRSSNMCIRILQWRKHEKNTIVMGYTFGDQPKWETKK